MTAPSSPKNRPWFRNALFVSSVRPAVAAVLSFLVARLFTLPEAYWAAVTTVVVAQSVPGTSFAIAGRRLLGTAMGALLATALALFLPPGIWTAGLGILLLGFICAAVGRMSRECATAFDRTTHRFAGITLLIILLVPRLVSISTAATHRFLEVSIGIAVALVLAVVWPERSEETPK